MEQATIVQEYDRIVYQGADFYMKLTLQDKTGVAINLTGCTARMHIRNVKGGSTLIYDATPNITITAATGQIEVNIPAAQTQLFTLTAAYYDIELTYPSTRGRRLLQGTLTLDVETTKQ